MCTSLSTNRIPIGQTFKFAIFFWWFGSCCDFLFKWMQLIIGTRCVWFIWLVCGLGNICLQFFSQSLTTIILGEFTQISKWLILNIQFNNIDTIMTRLLTRILWSLYCAVLDQSIFQWWFCRCWTDHMFIYACILPIVRKYTWFSCALSNSRQFFSTLSVAKDSGQSEPSFITLL